MIEALMSTIGDGWTLVLAGALVGAIFGAAAQHSRFCLRAATVEVAEGALGPRLAVWLLAFCAAIVVVQGAILSGLLDVGEARQLASRGSLSGAIIGGTLFGVGMILSRGCASRLLVLASTGNLRALVTGLVLTLVAQASLRGILSPAREAASGIWVVEGGDTRDLLAYLGLSSGTVFFVFLALLALAFGFARARHVALSHAIAAPIVGIAVGLGWVLTFAIAQSSFDVVPISSVTFTGPSTDTLMGLVNAPELPASFGVGLVPGVVFGAGGMAILSGEFRVERFGPDVPMERYLIGACLMGFGAMLAGGCAVGAGISGGSIFSLTAWIAVFSMWVGAVTTHWLLRQRTGQAAAGAV